MKVRFHLGNGRHKGHWQVRSGRQVRYFDPSEVSLTMRGCRLVNQGATARRIHGGDDKTPCAWVECEAVEARPSRAVAGEPVRYNPRVEPNWIYRGSNADGMKFAQLATCGRSVVSITKQEIKR